MRILTTALAVLILAINVIPAHGAIYFSDDFNGATLNSNLSDSDNAFAVAGGQVRRNVPGVPDDRHYIETMFSDYVSHDFIAEITFTLTNAGDGTSNIIFFGLGSAQRDASFHSEPGDAIFFRIHALDDPNPPFRGAVDVASNPFGNGFNDVTYFSGGNLSSANSTHRAQIALIGNSLTFSIDENYGGTFSADFQIAIPDLATTAPFLNNTNSRIFFGTDRSIDAFDDLSITAPVPEPASCVIWGTLGIAGLVAARRRKKVAV